MDRSLFLSVVGASALGLALASAVSAQPGVAAHLRVDGGVAQYWELDVEPPPVPDVDLSLCGPLDQYDEVVYGTPGPDEIVRGNGRQVLVGLGGDDRLEGGNHDDCLVGGPGDDTLLGGNGKDVLVGGAGADSLDGQNGPDLLLGDPSDTCTVAQPDAAHGCPPDGEKDDVAGGDTARDGTAPPSGGTAPPAADGSDDADKRKGHHADHDRDTTTRSTPGEAQGGDPEPADPPQGHQDPDGAALEQGSAADDVPPAAPDGPSPDADPQTGR